MTRHTTPSGLAAKRQAPCRGHRPYLQAHAQWRALSALGLVLALSGCASTAPKPPEPTPTQLAEAQAEAQNRAMLDAFSAEQRRLAEAAEERGEWSRAAWAWEALAAVKPTDATVSTRLARARQAADSLSVLRVQQARLALQLNDLDNARELFMRALVAQPDQADAVEGLRALERERLRQQQLAQPSRVGAPRQARAPRAELEHASLLASQGHLASAIALLMPLAQGRNADQAARRSLSDLYLRQAEAQFPTDPVQARATLQQSLQMNSRNARAASLLREWRRATAPGSNPAQPR